VGCQVEVSATGRSLFQRTPTDCGVCLSVIKWEANKSKNLDTCCEQVEEVKDYERTIVYCRLGLPYGLSFIVFDRLNSVIAGSNPVSIFLYCVCCVGLPLG
jgi:hypothetical protein